MRKLTTDWRSKLALGVNLRVLKMLLAFSLVERDMRPGPERESHLWRLTPKGYLCKMTL